jgi:hypothetical protein
MVCGRDKKQIRWGSIIGWHIMAGPLFLLTFASFTAEFPNLAEGVIGLIGMIILLIPLLMTYLFSFIPFLALAVLSGMLIKHAIPTVFAVLISGSGGAFSGYLWPKLFDNSPPGESTPVLIFPAAAAQFCCYMLCIRCHNRLRR